MFGENVFLKENNKIWEFILCGQESLFEAQECWVWGSSHNISVIIKCVQWLHNWFWRQPLAFKRNVTVTIKWDWMKKFQG